ncbi:hypothetical protein GQ600_14565 [Phytophthora cactorum]|nr:hypothetical protein GQ600_14565 [Phytophthora cactorum]
MFITYGTYTLEGRKTEVAEGRCYNMHHLDDSESPMDVLSIDDMADIVIKTDDSAAGCENARVEWGKKMSEQAFITLLNCVVRDLNRNGVFTRGYIRQQWRDIWFTSHTFRRAGAQYRPTVSELNTREHNQRDECRTNINSPTSKGLEGYVPMYWNADTARLLFKSVREWTSLERTKSGVFTRRLGVAKLIAEDVRDSAIQKEVLSPRNVADSTLSTYAVYYTEHWLKDTAEMNVLTIDTLARYIRLGRKCRLVKSKHAICSALNISLAVYF